MLRLALPAGDLRRPLADALTRAGLQIAGYGEGSRSYRLSLDGKDGVTVRVFREKDIPIQIALGNYDVGVCGLAWVEEFLARFPREAVVKLGDLGVGGTRLFVAAAAGSFEALPDVSSWRGVRIAAEYANLAEQFAMAARLPGYRIIPVSGAGEAYPPEDADLALIAAGSEQELRRLGLAPLWRLLEGSAWLIANRESLRAKDLSPVLGPLSPESGSPRLDLPSVASEPRRQAVRGRQERDTLRLALPDGHQQPHAVETLRAASLPIEGYGPGGDRRPKAGIEGLEVKVIRPQDMPQMVAAGSFDLALTGRDCFLDHVYRFPSSPVEITLDLGRAAFDMCAVVSVDLPANTLEEAVRIWETQGRTRLRLASEFVNIADQYARSNHFRRYQLVPTAGASEGFVPEDADLLIEGTETGQTLAENGLKAIDVLFRSTTCVIARKGERISGRRGQLLSQVLERLRRGAAEPSATIEAKG
ncbi:MAG: ATP phosphoribosyltransferase [Chloroflexi bacterium]|nr:ATP phosphoribosyltransferase [Chloroflexota bacterium]